MNTNSIPAYARWVLEKFRGVRPTRDGWEAFCPCPGHNRDGDQHRSLRAAIGDDGRVLIKCRVGCPTDAVLDAVGLDHADLFRDDGADAIATASTGAEPARPEHRAPTERAAPDLVHRAYDALLAALSLSPRHRDDLRRRGLTDAAVDLRGYRTLRNDARGVAAKAVHQQIGDAVRGVPGFVVGEYGVTLHGTATGLLVPVRDLRGQIVALKIRRAAEPKYVYLSDPDYSPGSPIHVPLGVPRTAAVVRVTEGELKADVCTTLERIPTIGVPGVTQWRDAIPLLKEMRASTVILAFDAPDVRSKAPVFEQAELFWSELGNEGFDVELEDWDGSL